MFDNSALFRISQEQLFFHRDPPTFPLILTEALAKCPLIQPSFSYSFFFEADVVWLLTNL